MKNLKLLFVVCFIALKAAAQSPYLINYQGVARDAGGNPIAGQLIKVRLKIRDNTATGPLLYNETDKVITTASGLFNIQIGGPDAFNVTGTLAAINWNAGKKFLQVEMDPAGGSNFINMGAQQLVSVPFAFQAALADSLNPGATVGLSQLAKGGATASQILQYDGTKWAPATIQNNLELPYRESDSTQLTLLDIENNFEDSAAFAIKGEANGVGVYGASQKVQGVCGSSKAAFYPGVYGFNDTLGGIGVLGRAQGPNWAVGVKGVADAVSGTGVMGTSLNGNGVVGQTAYSGGYGVWGYNAYGVAIRGVTVGPYYMSAGVEGEALSSSATGVRGKALSGVGVYGSSDNGAGVLGECTDSYGGNFTSVNSYGLYAFSNNNTAGLFQSTAGNLAGKFIGPVDVTADITVNGGKGIVSNSTSAQLRYATMTTQLVATNISPGTTLLSGVYLFPVAYSTPPVVTVGNIVSSTGTPERALVVAFNVTSTSCQFKITNCGPTNLTCNGTWNVSIIGQ